MQTSDFIVHIKTFCSKLARLRWDRPGVWFDIAFAVFFGFTFVVGSRFYELGYFNWDIQCWINGFVNSLCLLVFFVILRWALCFLGSSKNQNPKRGPGKSLLSTIAENKRYVALIAIILGICWVPYLVLMYPGNLNNDTTGQLAMFYSLMEGGDYHLADHHPIFDTMVFGAIVYAGQCFFGSFQAGVCFCIGLQMIATAVTFGIVFAVANVRWGASRTLCWILVGALALFPVIPLILTSLSKDTFAGWIYLWFFMFYLDLLIESNSQNNQDVSTQSKAYSANTCLINRSYLITFTIVCLLVCLTKKTGVYLVGGSLILFILFAKQTKGDKARLVLPLVLSIVVMCVLLPVLFKVVDVTPGSKKEMLAVPIQQSALVYQRHEFDMPLDQREQLEGIFDISHLRAEYDPFMVDPAKENATFTTFTEYAKLYAAQAYQYPDTYLDAWATLVSPLFADARIWPLFSSGHHTWNNNYLPESYFTKDAIATSQSITISETYDKVSSLPIIKQLFSQRLFVVVFPAFMLLCLLRQSAARKYWVGIIPIAIGFAFLLLSPTLGSNAETTRYLIPFVYEVPLIIVFVQVLYRGIQEDNFV